MKPQTLSPTDWIQAGFRALTTGGPQAIRAEALARTLSVSKGSFYWHFKDVAALKKAMIEHWQQVATHAVISALNAKSAPPRENLMRLIDIIVDDRKDAYGGPLTEAAIRDWGRYDANVASVVRGIDTARMQYVAGLIQKLGFEPEAARTKTRIFYATLIGLEQLSGHGQVSVGPDLTQLLNSLLATQPKPQPGLR